MYALAVELQNSNFNFAVAPIWRKASYFSKNPQNCGELSTALFGNISAKEYRGITA